MEWGEGLGALGGRKEGFGAELGAGWSALTRLSREPRLTRLGSAGSPGRIRVPNVTKRGALGGPPPVGGAVALSGRGLRSL